MFESSISRPHHGCKMQIWDELKRTLYFYCTRKSFILCVYISMFLSYFYSKIAFFPKRVSHSWRNGPSSLNLNVECNIMSDGIFHYLADRLWVPFSMPLSPLKKKKANYNMHQLSYCFASHSDTNSYAWWKKRQHRCLHIHLLFKNRKAEHLLTRDESLWENKSDDERRNSTKMECPRAGWIAKSHHRFRWCMCCHFAH